MLDDRSPVRYTEAAKRSWGRVCNVILDVIIKVRLVAACTEKESTGNMLFPSVCAGLSERSGLGDTSR